MKTLLLLWIVVIATFLSTPAMTAEIATPVALSLLSRTNTAGGKPIACFGVTNATTEPYYYYFQTQVPTPLGWHFARNQSTGAASAHTLFPGQTNIIQVTPPRGADRWRLHLRYRPHRRKAQDRSLASQEIIANASENQNPQPK
jgi:hypothetical protein